MKAEILLPLPVPGTYTYLIPPDMEEEAVFGKRVEVQFGRKKLYTGLIVGIESGTGDQLKMIRDILDDEPVIREIHYRFWKWMAEYYCSFLGDVMNAALPAPLKIDSETVLQLNVDHDYDEMDLEDDAFLISDALSIQNELTWGDIQEILQKKSINKNVNELIDAGMVDVKEKALRKNTHETVKTLMWAAEYRDNQKAVMEQVSRSKKQTRAVLAFTTLRREKKPPISRYEVMTKSDTDHATIRALIKKGILLETKIKKNFLGELIFRKGMLPPLVDFQKKALAEMEQAFESTPVVLLEGVTGSGKTRLYLEWIRRVKEAGQQILFMIPEIALTTHIIHRLEAIFESDVIVYHSRVSEKSRMEAYHSVRFGAPLVIGTRSALLLPFQNLGLIIVDEEHDRSYKQLNPAPRYHGRDSAVYLALLSDARVILGSATPSLESLVNVQEGKYGHVMMKERFGLMEMPEIQIVDMRQVQMSEEQAEIGFSPQLLQAIHQMLDAGRQVMVFQNRRGFAPVFLCDHCGHVVQCDSCDVSMTYHKFSEKLQCHYCRKEKPVPKECPSCHFWSMKMYGMGTEKLEEHLQSLLPDATIDRMDYDTASGRKRLERILTRFSNNETQILVGTQMIAKGLDFENVGLVVVPRADQLFSFPDFRSAENALQMLRQVSGRSGRKKEKGQVLIQTYNPDHPVIQSLMSGDDRGFYQQELEERKVFRFAPYYRMVKVTFRNKNRKKNTQVAYELYHYLQASFGDRVSVPVEPLVSYINHYYLLDVFVKLHRNRKEGTFFRKRLNHFIREVKSRPGFSNFRMIVNVDPI
ncbi:primosomal protein N' [Membranicola marinus]|uniref:Replication restart protein PriA n=1 Tax=Membranihabitans marinus TaxID=1227546 RepID=A0A953HRH2_9BACT|nr:primosomal protein N' [Membranihabitans marinus]MBY5956553.1 primosomal protein N' [Membranihabitans marinus]